MESNHNDAAGTLEGPLHLSLFKHLQKYHIEVGGGNKEDSGSDVSKDTIVGGRLARQESD